MFSAILIITHVLGYFFLASEFAGFKGKGEGVTSLFEPDPHIAPKDYFVHTFIFSQAARSEY